MPHGLLEETGHEDENALWDKPLLQYAIEYPGRLLEGARDALEAYSLNPTGIREKLTLFDAWRQPFASDAKEAIAQGIVKTDRKVLEFEQSRQGEDYRGRYEPLNIDMARLAASILMMSVGSWKPGAKSTAKPGRPGQMTAKEYRDKYGGRPWAEEQRLITPALVYQQAYLAITKMITATF